MSTDNKKQQAFDKRYLRMARIWAENSYCQRRTVGALIVKDNAISKLARSNNNSEGDTLYITASPCLECAKLIIQAGIKRVVYGEPYRIADGLHLLQQAGISVEILKLDDEK